MLTVSPVALLGPVLGHIGRALAPLRIGTSAGLEQTGYPNGEGTLAGLTEEIAVSTFNGHETLRVSMRDQLRA